jgi:hypothetical protein
MPQPYGTMAAAQRIFLGMLHDEQVDDGAARCTQARRRWRVRFWAAVAALLAWASLLVLGLVEGDVASACCASLVFPPIAAVLYYLSNRAEWDYIRLTFQRRICPNCGYDLRASRHRCSECGGLIDPWWEAKQ